MSWKESYQRWIKNANQLPKELKVALEESDEKTLEDAFYKSLEFGTGGLRGEIGPGTNRMNIYTIRKTAEGLAKYIVSQGEEAKSRGVAIAYDCRHYSPEFSLEAAKVLAHHGIKVYLFDSLRPTPMLSFAVRYLHTFAGIVVTASHNPPEYNGFKVYGPDGAQLPPIMADEIMSHIDKVEGELTVEVAEEQDLLDKDLLTYISDTVDNAYYKQLQTIIEDRGVIQEVDEDFKIVFTALHGTANIPVQRGLKDAGFSNVTVVKEQMNPDPEFSTVSSPNPEEHVAFELATQYGEKEHADILIGTDPDADRMGVAVKNEEGNYQVLTGNQVGALLLDYQLKQKHAKGELTEDYKHLKTIVTSEMGRAIADQYSIETINTLTGFKFIAEKIAEFEASRNGKFLIGYEESYGYLIKEFVRDKDAVQSCVAIAEVGAYHKSKGKTLYGALNDLYNQVGFFKEDLESITLKGKEGTETISKIMDSFRNNRPVVLADKKVLFVEDYKTSERYNEESEVTTITLPKSNVLKFTLEDDTWVCLRPSGTEPKIKFYFGVKGTSEQDSQLQLNVIKESVMGQITDLISSLNVKA